MKGALRLGLITLPLALGLLLTLVGLADLGFGLYALVWGVGDSAVDWVRSPNVASTP